MENRPTEVEGAKRDDIGTGTWVDYIEEIVRK